MAVRTAPPRELGYAEITADATSTATAANGTLATGLSVTVTVGSRPILIEFGTSNVQNSTLGANNLVYILEDATTLRASVTVYSGAANRGAAAYCARRLTPNPGTYTYAAYLWASAATSRIVGAATSPAWIRVTEI